MPVIPRHEKCSVRGCRLQFEVTGNPNQHNGKRCREAVE